MSTARYTQADLWGQPARRWVAHVDMDAFFASVEQRDDPSLRGLPVIVANSPLPMEKLREIAEQVLKLPQRPEYIKGVRGVVASASYEARAFGVRSAMPLARALSLCPDTLVLAGRFDRYREVAEHLRRIWADFSPVVEPVSLDEAYLDMTGSEVSDGPIRETAQRLKARILHETGLTASVGIGSSKLMAKIASDLDKPDGLVVIPHGDEARTLAPMPVRVLPGIGPKTAEALLALGITTLDDLATTREDILTARFGAEHANDMIRRASGVDHTPVQVPGDPRSISREITLVEDLTDLVELRTKLNALSEEVAWSLRREGFHARCIYIKLRLLPRRKVWQPEGSSFGRLITRRCTLPMPTDSGRSIYETVTRLLDTAARDTGLGAGEEVVRLLGIGTASLVHNTALMGVSPGARTSGAAHQQTTAVAQVCSAPSDNSPLVNQARDQQLNVSLDLIRQRFGFGAISLGASVKHPDVDQ